MPARDQSGPNNEGPKTGRGMGNCNEPLNSSSGPAKPLSPLNRFLRIGRIGRGTGRGIGRGRRSGR